jgi:hypothetical protein
MNDYPTPSQPNGHDRAAGFSYMVSGSMAMNFYARQTSNPTKEFILGYFFAKQVVRDS